MSGFDFNAAVPAGFKVFNHNETDHERYKREQEEVTKNFARGARERARDARRANLQVWDERTPQRWRKASVADLDEPDNKTILAALKSGSHSFYITGPSASGKTHAAYGIIRRLIAMGKALPSSVRVLSESEIIDYARGGFAGRDKLQEIYNDRKTQAIILDGVGFADDYTDRDAIAIERIVEKAYEGSMPLIITGSITPKDWVERLSQATESRLSSMFNGNVVTLSARDASPGF